LDDILLIVGLTTLCMVSPGPDMILVMQSTLTGDRRQGLLTSMGVLTGNLVHISSCALGFGYVVAHSVALYGVLKLAGALYLITLGARSLLAATRASEPRQMAESGRDRIPGAFRRGLVNNLLNPKGAPVRGLLERSRRWVEAAFGALLVLLGLRIAAEP